MIKNTQVKYCRIQRRRDSFLEKSGIASGGDGG
jgi:hypothetical protein